jgi:DNA-binding IscR family transcriptional regulator
MGVHVLAVLAYEEGDPVTSARLARSVNTNPVIIRRLLLLLQRTKLVETGKGAGSGSRLTRSPQRISLAEVYRAVEAAEPFATPSRKPNPACPIGHRIGQTLAGIFASAEAALERDLERTTLSDVLADCAKGRINRRPVEPEIRNPKPEIRNKFQLGQRGK